MKLIIWLCVVVLLMVGVFSIIIGVRGQEAIAFKNVSIQTFEFKNNLNHVLFVELIDGQKLEVKLSKIQKDELMKVLINKIGDLEIVLEKK